MFALMAARMPAFSVKTDSVDTAEMLIDAGVARRAAYMHRSWVSLPLDAAADELRHRIHESYRLIRGKLPRKLRAGLAPVPDA